ncbi:Endoribonuclease YbeY [Tenacibaculum sp. 190130A14a]|uniref:Endoribonuclease YbeY n=1 Tax=Tenacibaculum polynesiense TaxID=3137857 RepID=A0ABP1F5M4_9FLAO
MITFNYENDFKLENEAKTSEWIQNCIEKEGFELGELTYIFCNDDYLHKINVEFLNHDTLTDIISFDYTMGSLVGGDIFISTERVADNANDFDTTFADELHRVIIHGVLHYMKYKDKTNEEKEIMRSKENACLEILNQ